MRKNIRFISERKASNFLDLSVKINICFANYVQSLSQSSIKTHASTK